LSGMNAPPPASWSAQDRATMALANMGTNLYNENDGSS
jgi:hypothetical protein